MQFWKSLKERKSIFILILIIAVAIFFRFWQFSAIPGGLYQDEAMNGSDALKSLKTGNFSVFYPNNNGREGLIIWLDALAIKAFGTAPWVLRLFPALAGVLAVLGLYFLAKKLFGEKVAQVSGFFMATGFWAVNFSRTGFRAGLMVPILIWSFYFLLRAFRENRISFFVISGVIFGLGFYTYLPFRFAPLLALAAFFPKLIENKKLWARASLFVAAIFIVALPIGIYFLKNPGDFFGRSSQISIFSQASPVKSLAVNIVQTLGMFNFRGDFNWRHNFSGHPELFWPVGIAFLLGIVISLKRFRFEEKFAFGWFLIFLIPNFLAIEGNPHALRALGAMPMAMIFSGIGTVWVYEQIQEFFDKRIKDSGFSNFHRQLKRLKKESFVFLLVFLVFVAACDFSTYFNRWAYNINVAEAFSQSQVSLSGYLNNLPENFKKYVIWHPDDRPTDNGLPVSAQTVYFLTEGKSEITYLRADEASKIKTDSEMTVIAPTYFSINFLHQLVKKFPKSEIEFVDLNSAVVLVPRQ